jgi:hypothetical protein
MRNVPAPKRAGLERQQERRQAKEQRRTGNQKRLTPLEAEIFRCSAIAGHETTMAERDAIRQREIAELRAALEAGSRESERLTAAKVKRTLC